MKTNEFVKLINDTNYIHQKWAVIEVTVGSSLSNSKAWLKAVSFGWDTKENLTAFKLTSDGYKPAYGDDGHPEKQDEYLIVDKSGLVGRIGEYKVASLSELETYYRGGKIDFTPNIAIG